MDVDVSADEDEALDVDMDEGLHVDSYADVDSDKSQQLKTQLVESIDILYKSSRHFLGMLQFDILFISVSLEEI